VSRDVTLVLAYYRNPGMLRRQYDLLRALPADLRARVGLVVVDDGSPVDPARPPDPPLGLRAFSLLRMLVDVPWNQDACRNLAMTQVEGWALLTDVDHLVPEATWREVVLGKLDPATAHRFSRVSEPELAPYKPHPNTWLLTRELYDLAGGYDERFAGVYGTDGKFAKQVAAVAPVLQLKHVVVRVPREVTPDASTTTLDRRSPANDRARARANLAFAALSPEERAVPLRGTFPWARVV
jgi:hypothetical protein